MYDLHVARRLTHEEAKSLLTKVLSVPQPVVIDSIDEAVPDDAPLWCVLTHRGGDFPTSLEVYPRTMADRLLTQEDLGCRVAHELKCDVLVSDDDLNPFSWLLVDANCQATRVKVDPEAFERDEFKVEKA